MKDTAAAPLVRQALESERAVSATALAKCGRVLYAFSSFYFPFYARQPVDLFYKFDPYAWISAYIYDIDEDIENGGSTTAMFDQLDHLRCHLQKRLPVDGAVESLIEDARQYYVFEHHLLHGGEIFPQDLEDMIARRSFDFRLMHRVLAYETRGSFCESLFSWFRPFEMMMEIEDDIGSIEKDRDRGTFNFAVLAQRLYPASSASVIEAARARIDRQLADARQSLTPELCRICDQVQESYRDIVTRPELPFPRLESAGENS